MISIGPPDGGVCVGHTSTRTLCVRTPTAYTEAGSFSPRRSTTSHLDEIDLTLSSSGTTSRRCASRATRGRRSESRGNQRAEESTTYP